MKKYIIYTGVLAIGLLLGWLIFGGVTTPSIQEGEHQHELVETSPSSQIWTCSMHPQIRQPEPGPCPICAMDLIPAGDTSSEGLSPNQFKMTENAMALANIETLKVKEQAVSSSSLMLTGKIKENETGNALQTAHFGGRIEKLYINTTGETVNKGQLLALIYSPELVSTQGELLTALEMKTSQPNLYQAVRNKLKFWKLSDKQINDIEVSKNIIENFPVYANVSGVLIDKMVEQGNYVKAGQGLFAISNLNTVWAEFDVYENQISTIKKGDKVTITTHANPNEKIKAKVSFIDPILNTATRTVIVRAVLNNKKGNLKPGMFVNGVLNIEGDTEIKTILMLPKSAVLWTGKRSVVYVKVKGEAPVFEMREVILGNLIGSEYKIIEGIQVDDEIVIEGAFTVDASAQLQGKKSMMNPTSGVKPITGHEHHVGSITSTETKTDTRLQVSSEFQEQLKAVFNGYITLKDALVGDDSQNAKNASKGVLAAISKVNMKLLKSNDAHSQWMAFETAMYSAANSISATDDIKVQREAFIALSDNMLKSISAFGINQKVYKLFCPMANDNKGAFWVSTEEKIKNPFFGSSMLNCGNVDSVIE